uniref:Uncharacterized protein n=1 Tax=Arundo donax TaxID=35708 RepID=A0A0A9GHX0_ARUDO
MRTINQLWFFFTYYDFICHMVSCVALSKLTALCFAASEEEKEG